MIFSCDRCGRRYSVPDERVRGKTFRVTCKSCGNVIVVRPDVPEPTVPEAPPPRPTPSKIRDPFAEVPPPPPQAAPRPPAPPPAKPAPAQAERTTTGPLIQVSGIGKAPVRAHDSSRALTAAEMAWMSDDDSRPLEPIPEPEVGPPAEATEDVSLEEEAVPGHAGQKGPGIVRIVLAAVLLGLGAAAMVAFFVWPGRGSRPAPSPAPMAAAAPAPTPAPPPAPAATPAPPPPPVVAVAPEPASPPPPAEPAAPPPVPPPAPVRKVSPGAHFEPGTATVGRVRRKEQPKLNRKDRRLLDLLARKHDETAPSEPVEKLDLDTARTLDQAAVERVIEESQGAFSGCVTRAAKVTGLPASRRATLLLTVARTGEVATAWVAEAEISRTGLGRCLVGAARRLAFPAFEGEPVDVSVPLTLEAR